MSSTSFVKRYAVTIAANCVRGFLLYLAGIIVARSLSLPAYGEYSYLVAVFIALNSLLDLGGNTAFYTFMAEKPRSACFVLSYLLWQVLQIGVVLSALYLLPLSWAAVLWPQLSTATVALGFIAIFCQYQLWNSISALGDAVRNTAVVQLFNVLATFCYTLVLGVTAESIGLSVDSAFVILFSGFFITLGFALAWYWRHLKRIGYFVGSERQAFRETLGEYSRFCLPLAINCLFVFVSMFVFRWLVQTYAGSETQGYFSAGQHLAMPAMLLSTSLARLVWKEVAEAKSRVLSNEIQGSFTKTLIGLALVNGLWICFAIPWMDHLVRLMLGANYAGGAITCGLLLYASLFQAIGQVVSVYFYATQRTREFAWLLCFASGLEILASFGFLLYCYDPASWWANHHSLAFIRCAGQVLAMLLLVAAFVPQRRLLMAAIIAATLGAIAFSYSLRCVVSALNLDFLPSISLAFFLYGGSAIIIGLTFARRKGGISKTAQTLGWSVRSS